MQQEMKLRRRIAGGAMACVLSCGLMVPQLAFATPDSSSKQAEAQAVLASLNSMQYQLDQASADYGQALEEQAQAQQSADQAEQRGCDKGQHQQVDHKEHRARDLFPRRHIGGALSSWHLVPSRFSSGFCFSSFSPAGGSAGVFF